MAEEKKTPKKSSKKKEIKGSTDPVLDIAPEFSIPEEITPTVNERGEVVVHAISGGITITNNVGETKELYQFNKSIIEPETESLDIKDLEVARKMLKIFQSANDRNLEFDLSFKTVKRLMSYKKCYYTGKEFKEDGPLGRSFDRVDSSKGYIEGNVVACTIDINQKKSNLSNEEITILYEKLVLKK